MFFKEKRDTKVISDLYLRERTLLTCIINLFKADWFSNGTVQLLNNILKVSLLTSTFVGTPSDFRLVQYILIYFYPKNKLKCKLRNKACAYWALF